MTSLLTYSGALVWVVVVLIILSKLFRFLQGRRSESISDKWILVTGCDSGFGLGLVEQLSRANASVIACTLSKEGAENSLKAGAKHALRFDLTDEVALCGAASDIIEATGEKLYGVIHNAGIVLPGFVEYQPLGNYQKVMDVNFFSIVSLTQKLIPALKRGRGRLVFLSSVDGIVSLPGNAPYDASKFAVEAYADALRVELSFWDISVSVVNPATMRTPMAKGFFPAHKLAWDEMNEQNPDGNWKKGWSREWLEEYITRNQSSIETIAQDPKHAVNDIMHAISSKNPEFRYLSGTLAKTLFYSLWKMPERWSFAIKKATVNPPPITD